MQKYIEQLLADIAFATESVALPFAEKATDLWDWMPPDEEERMPPVRNLEEWTGIHKEQLPPPEMLTDDQVDLLIQALIKMLNEYNWCFVMQIEVPERIQYAALRDNFNQQARIMQWHYGFFELCRAGTEHKKCALGEYCHCAFFADMFSEFEDEDLTPQEERDRKLDLEIQYLKKKHGDDWRKYYPYHLDKNYDDQNENDNDDEKDDWWRK